MVKVYYKNSAGSVIDLASKNYKMHKATDLLSYRWSWSNSEYINKIESFSMEYAEKSIMISIMAANREEYAKALDAISDAFEYDVKMLSPGKLYVGDYYLSCYIISADQSQFNPHRLRTDKTYGILAESGQWLKEAEYDLSVLTELEDEADLALKSAHIFNYPINLLQTPKYKEIIGQNAHLKYVSAAPNVKTMHVYGITKKEGATLRCMERAVVHITELETGNINDSQSLTCRLHGIPVTTDGNCFIDGVEYLSDVYFSEGEVRRYYKEVELNGSEEWAVHYDYDSENGTVNNVYFYLNIAGAQKAPALCDRYEYVIDLRDSHTESFTMAEEQLRISMDEYADGVESTNGLPWPITRMYDETVPLFRGKLATTPIKVVYRVAEYVEYAEPANIILPLTETELHVKAIDQKGAFTSCFIYMKYRIRAVENAVCIRNKITPATVGDIWVGTVDMEQGTVYQMVASMEGYVFKVERPDGIVEAVTDVYYTAGETGVHKIIVTITELQEFYVVVNTGESFAGYPPSDYKIRALKEGEVVMEQIATGSEMYMHGDLDVIESDYNVEYELAEYQGASALDYPYDFPYDLASPRITKYVNNRNVVAADFIMLIYGPCVNPAVYINGHLYQVNVTLYTGEYLEINSKAKRIIKVKADGEEINCFYLRNKDSYIFQKIVPGQQAVVKDGFGIKLTILEERSEARWWS